MKKKIKIKIMKIIKIKKFKTKLQKKLKEHKYKKKLILLKKNRTY